MELFVKLFPIFKPSNYTTFVRAKLEYTEFICSDDNRIYKPKWNRIFMRWKRTVNLTVCLKIINLPYIL